MKKNYLLSLTLLAAAWFAGGSAMAHDGDHTYVNGICTIEGCETPFQAPVKVDGVYQLANAGNIEFVAQKGINNEKDPDDAAYMGSSYVLTADIDYTGIKHIPFGKSEQYKFDGDFDGQWHRISNLVMDGSENTNGNHIGFFGVLRGGGHTIQNIIFDKSCSFHGNNRVGALCGSVQRAAAILYIKNIINEADVTAENEFAAAFVGGRATNADDPRVFLDNCINLGDITVKGEGKYAAAIINGVNCNGASGGSSTLTACVNAGKITPANGQNILFTGSFRAYNYCYDIPTAKKNNQNIAANFKTDDPLASGEVAYLINAEANKQILFQTLPGDAYPTGKDNGKGIYESATYNCAAEPQGGVTYVNVDGGKIIPDHQAFDENGFCPVCHKNYKEPELVDDWYQITNAGELEWFSALTNKGTNTKKAKLMNDINMLGITNLHTPIGSTETYKFNGEFDGQGHSIKNMVIDLPGTTGVGFFGWLRGGGTTIVKNLIIDETCSIHGGNKVGGITGTYQVGGGSITIENVINGASIVSEGNDAGGIFGGENGNTKIILRNVINKGEITAKGGWGGAIVCYLNCSDDSEIENIVNLGKVNAPHNGGIMGRMYFGNRKNIIDLSDSEFIDSDEKSFEMVSGLEKADIASGKLAYYINSTSDKGNFKQLIGTDAYPSPFNEAEVYAVGEAGYATMVADADVKLNGNAKAYIGKKNGEYLTLTEVADVPENEAVVLKGTYYNKVATTATADCTGNDLKGTTEETVADNMYVLAKKNDVIGFYMATGTIPAGKAYIQSAAGVKAFFFGDDATGIELTPDNGQQTTEIFNLAGQRVSKMQKGVNIVNGKKVMF